MGAQKDGEPHNEYTTLTSWEKVVADYSGISVPDVQRLDFLDYLCIRRDAFIQNMNKTEEGRAFLDEVWLISQTSMDIKSMREHFG